MSEQRKTASLINAAGDLVFLQDGGAYEEDAMIVIRTPEAEAMGHVSGRAPSRHHVGIEPLMQIVQNQSGEWDAVDDSGRTLAAGLSSAAAWAFVQSSKDPGIIAGYEREGDHRPARQTAVS